MMVCSLVQNDSDLMEINLNSACRILCMPDKPNSGQIFQPMNERQQTWLPQSEKYDLSVRKGLNVGDQ